MMYGTITVGTDSGAKGCFGMPAIDVPVLPAIHTPANNRARELADQMREEIAAWPCPRHACHGLDVVDCERIGTARQILSNIRTARRGTGFMSLHHRTGAPRSIVHAAIDALVDVGLACYREKKLHPTDLALDVHRAAQWFDAAIPVLLVAFELREIRQPGQQSPVVAHSAPETDGTDADDGEYDADLDGEYEATEDDDAVVALLEEGW